MTTWATLRATEQLTRPDPDRDRLTCRFIDRLPTAQHATPTRLPSLAPSLTDVTPRPSADLADPRDATTQHDDRQAECQNHLKGHTWCTR